MDNNDPDQPRQSPYANTSQVQEADRPLLPGITRREDDLGADLASSSAGDVRKPVGAQHWSVVSAEYQAGMGANETIDGLSGTEEAVRVAAGDEAEANEDDDMPVFDRADTIPKII